MKSDELAQIYFNADDKDAATQSIAQNLFADMSELIKQRKPKFTCAYQSIFKEINDKWNAVNRKIGGKLIQDGFYFVLGEVHPELKSYLPKTLNA